MRTGTTRTAAAILVAGLFGTAGGAQEAARVAPEPGPGRGENALTRYLDWADIHPAVHLDGLTIFPIALARPAERLGDVLTMQQAIDRGVLVVEELDPPEIERARFTNKSGDRMVFLMAGEVIRGGRQNRTLQTDALLGPDSTTVLPLYCVQKGRWSGGGKFDSAAAVAPQAVRERAALRAGQEEVWREVARANEQLGARSASEDLAEAMGKTEVVGRLAELRRRVEPHLPAGCVGVVAAVRGRIVAADLFNNPALFSAMREKVLNSYLSQYGWQTPLPVRRLERDEGDEARGRVLPVPAVTAEQVRDYLRGCYDSRLTGGDLRGVGRVYYLRGARSGQVLTHEDRIMVHAALMGSGVVPVRPDRPPRPVPLR